MSGRCPGISLRIRCRRIGFVGLGVLSVLHGAEQQHRDDQAEELKRIYPISEMAGKLSGNSLGKIRWSIQLCQPRAAAEPPTLVHYPHIPCPTTKWDPGI